MGDKDDEVQFDDLDEVLAYLRRMGAAKWRRPNASGSWGIVSEVRWGEPSSIGNQSKVN